MSKNAPIAQSGIGQLGGYATNESGGGLSARNLAYMRISFLLYRQRSSILQTAIAKYSASKKLQPVVAQLPACEKSQLLPGQLQDQIGIRSALPLQIVQSATGKSAALFSLGWSSYNAKEYQLYLPSKEELRRKLKEWVREVDVG